MKIALKLNAVIVAALVLLAGCSNSSEMVNSSTAVATDIARETACWGYFNSVQPANLNKGTQEERRKIVRAIFAGAIYSSDPLLVLAAEKMIKAIESEDADAYRAGSITFITACQEAGLWE
jgi:hypothetical protein